MTLSVFTHRFTHQNGCVDHYVPQIIIDCKCLRLSGCMISTFLVSDCHVIKTTTTTWTKLFPVLLVMTSILLTPSEAIGQKRRPSPPIQSLCNTKGPKACIHFGKCQLADCSKSNNCDKCRQVCLGKKILMTKTSFVSKMKTSGAFNYPFCSLKAPIDVKNFQSWYWQTRRLIVSLLKFSILIGSQMPLFIA